MLVILVILVVIICVLLCLAVLIQNPKGGGLTATFGGVGNQILGAHRSTDYVEKVTWGLAVALMALSLVSPVFLDRPDGFDEAQVETSVTERNYDPTITPTAPPSDPQGE